MQRRNAWVLGLALFLIPFAAAPVAEGLPFLSPHVTVEYDHSAALGRRTYSWGDTRMALPRYVDIVKALIDKDLKARGWQFMPSGGSATVFLLGNTSDGPSLVAYYAGDGGLWAQNWGPQGWGPGWKPGYGLQVYDALGTAGNHVVVDIFDTSSHRLMFRGVTGEDLSNSEKKNTKTFAKSLKAIFKKLPKS